MALPRLAMHVIPKIRLQTAKYEFLSFCIKTGFAGTRPYSFTGNRYSSYRRSERISIHFILVDDPPSPSPSFKICFLLFLSSQLGN